MVNEPFKKLSTAGDKDEGKGTQAQTTTAAAEQPKTAEELRQQAQRDETQAFLDQQQVARDTMAAETKAREERERKAAGKK